jgi:hypothetical protein
VQVISDKKIILLPSPLGQRLAQTTLSNHTAVKKGAGELVDSVKLQSVHHCTLNTKGYSR